RLSQQACTVIDSGHTYRATGLESEALCDTVRQLTHDTPRSPAHEEPTRGSSMQKQAPTGSLCLFLSTRPSCHTQLLLRAIRRLAWATCPLEVSSPKSQGEEPDFLRRGPIPSGTHLPLRL